MCAPEVSETMRAPPRSPADTAVNVARTLLSTSIGVKYEASTRQEFLAKMTIAIDLLLLALTRGSRCQGLPSAAAGTD
jgi:hypothetical protein